MAPRWFTEGIVYLVFPERFAIGGGRTVHDKIAAGLYPAGAVGKDWATRPVGGPDAARHFWGGDLDGIREHLDYIQALGADILCLTPVQPAPSNHKYDTTDLAAIDPAFGGEAAFTRLVDELHRRGMRLIVDLAVNHVSDTHPWFQAARSAPDSPYRDWFHFRAWPDDYLCWFGHRSMPELNLRHAPAMEEILAVFHRWLERGVDGFRLDCANDLGLDVVAAITRTVHGTKPEAVVIGEVSNFADAWARVMDGVQSYWSRRAVLGLLAGEIGARQCGHALADVRTRFGLEASLASFSLFSSHDAPRLLSELAGDYAKLAFALTLQFTLPGVPLVYYGEENGMTGKEDPANRAAMVRDPRQYDARVRALYDRLIALRRSIPALRSGDFLELGSRLDDGTIAFLRHGEHPSDYCLVAANPGRRTVTPTVMMPHPHIYSQLAMHDALGGPSTMSYTGCVRLTLRPKQAAVYVPDFACKPGYRFDKRHD